MKNRIANRIVLILFLGINLPLFSESPALELSKTVDPIWLILCAALVFFMQAGFLMLETGLSRLKNTINVAVKKSYGLYRRNDRVFLRRFCIDVRTFL